MNISEKKYYVTHVVKDSLPSKGFRKLHFYTGTAESIQRGKYYWGKGNNGNDKSLIDALVAKGEILELTEEILLIPQKGLWIDPTGKVYLADIKDPVKDINEEKQRPVLTLNVNLFDSAEKIYRTARANVVFEKPRRAHSILYE